MIKHLAITQRVIRNDTYIEIRDALSHDWLKYLSVTLPDTLVLPVANIPEHVDKLFSEIKIDGVLLSNGNDWGDSLERDETETILFKKCRQEKTPVLGICRGFQAINIMMGAKIEPEIKQVSNQSHVSCQHPVSIIDNGFQQLFGEEEITVNSYHNQGIVKDGLAPDLIAFAMAEGGVVEGFYHRSEPILAVQWHPERASPSTKFNQKLVEKFFEEGAWW